ncbi:MAG: type II secretion system inner membrane protein GspF [Gammaproteobacteria bacterium]|nr:type II secretion system inner membrane protein GspF [Gammaproteobacteria bacterium]
MGAFEYVAVDANGKSKKGLIEADTARQVRQQLRQKQLLPVEVNEVDQTRSNKRNGSGPAAVKGRAKLSAMELAVVTRQLATLIKAGMPIEDCLRAVGEQSDRPRIKRVILGVRTSVMEGQPFARSMARFPRSFPELYRATVAAGEQSGHLGEVLERLADYTEERQVLGQKVSHALIYPILLTVVAVSIIIFLLVVMVPKVVSVYADANRELPGLTRAMIATSDFIRHYIWLLVILGVGLFFGLGYVFRSQKIKPKAHAVLLRLPIIGRLIRGFNTARFTRTLSILTGSGVPVLEALRIAAEVISSIPMRDAVHQAAIKVREGGSIARSLDESKLFPAISIHLISSGEASGQLEEMLARAATSQEREMSATVATLLAIMEPALILIMGVMVLIIVLAILLPILDLNQLFA